MRIDQQTALWPGVSSNTTNYHNWTINGTQFHTPKRSATWIIAYAAAILADIQSYTKSSSTSLSNLVSYATSVASDGNYYSFTKYLNMIYYQQQRQWGYGYGGTAVITNNSPASWLQALSSNSVSTASDGKSYSFAKYLNMINSHMADLVTNVGWPYNGTSVTGFLNAINTEANNQTKTLEAMRKLLLSQNQNDEDWSVTKYANSINDKMGQLLNNVGWPYDGTSVTGFLNMIVELSRTNSTILDSITKGPEGGRVSLYNIGNSIETIKNETRDLDNLLESIDGRVAALDALGVRLANIALTADEIKKGVNSSLQWYDTLHGDLSMLRHGAADLLPGYVDWTVWDFLQGIYFDLGQIVDLLKGLQQTLTSWGNRWDSQDLYLMEWAKRWDALDKGVSWSESDKGALFVKLDGISDRLSVEAGKTILDTIFGDMTLDATEAASAAVGSAIQNAFPFCVPAVLKQILGLLQADPAPPEFHFDFWGAPLDFGFSDWQGLADMTSWLSRIGFAVVLFANSRRFVYSGGVAGD